MNVWLKSGGVLISPESGNMLVFPAPMSLPVSESGSQGCFLGLLGFLGWCSSCSSNVLEFGVV